VYCQLGRTTDKTAGRREYTPLDGILAELKNKLSTQPDYITMSGSGEPTLHSRLGEAIERIKAMTEIPVAVLTNGSLLWDADVRAALAPADLVVPSLDAGSAVVFEKINRPHKQIDFERMVDGLIEFGRTRRNECRLEVFLLEGINAATADVADIAAIAQRIRPDRVELNTVVRPPAETCTAVEPGKLLEFAAMFDPPAETCTAVEPGKLLEFAAMFDPPAEAIGAFRAVHQQQAFTAEREAVLIMLQRRPCSLDDIAAGLAIHRNEAAKHVGELLAQELVEMIRTGDTVYYRPVEK